MVGAALSGEKRLNIAMTKVSAKHGCQTVDSAYAPKIFVGFPSSPVPPEILANYWLITRGLMQVA
jgi:hypothetical protein